MDDTRIVSYIRSILKGDETHVCSARCEVAPLRVHLHEKDGLHVRWVMNNKPWMNRSNFVRAVHNIFVCKKTRCVHLCDQNCSLEKITTEDYCVVCPVSGIQRNNDCEVVESWKLNSKSMPNISTDKRDPNMYSKCCSGKFSD